GGLVGLNSGTISNCYAQNSVAGDLLYVGGLVGGQLGGQVDHSYSAGAITGASVSKGGLVGGDSGTTEIYISDYWDQQRNPLIEKSIGTQTEDPAVGEIEPKNTAQMRAQATFIGDDTAQGRWDFATIWYVHEGYAYPIFRWSVVSNVDHFVLTLASPQTNGVAFINVCTLAAMDDEDHVITTFDASADNVIFTIDPNNGTITGLGLAGHNVLDQAGDFVDGVANLTSLGIKFTGTAGDHTFTATSVNLKTGDSEVTIVAGALDHFALLLDTPQANAAAFTGTNTLTAQDVSNNVITTYDASVNNVTMTSSSLAGVITGLGSGNNNVLNQGTDFVDGVADLSTMIYTGTAGKYTFTATSADVKAGHIDNITITAGALNYIIIFPKGNTITADETQVFTAEGFDVSGNSRGDVTGATTFSVTAGTGSFNVNTYSPDKVGVITIHGVDGAFGDDASLTVIAGALDHFTFLLSSPQASAVAFTGANTLIAEDAKGNTITTYDASVNNVAITVTPNDGIISGFSLGSTLSAAGDFVNGVADLTSLGMKFTSTVSTFSNGPTRNRSGAHTFTATSADNKIGVSNPIMITAPSFNIDPATLDNNPVFMMISFFFPMVEAATDNAIAGFGFNSLAWQKEEGSYSSKIYVPGKYRTFVSAEDESILGSYDDQGLLGNQTTILPGEKIMMERKVGGKANVASRVKLAGQPDQSAVRADVPSSSKLVGQSEESAVRSDVSFQGEFKTVTMAIDRIFNVTPYHQEKFIMK
ncbi:MAG: hypothetical protein NT079_01120, partial [Candidatus Omnitrophica bacterium]|nr:hypothetical protein [Candidatus Omnitrophota bacterium]